MPLPLSDRRFSFHLLTLLLGLTALAGCSQRQALKLDPTFLSSPPETIVLMPFVDARRDKSEPLEDLMTSSRRFAEKGLEEKGYAHVTPEVADLPAAESMREMTTQELAAFGPDNQGPLLYFFLEDLKTEYVVMAKTVKYEGRMLLIDPIDGRLLWEDREAGSFGQGGLISGLLPYREEGIRACLYTMMQSLPKRPKK